MEKLAELDENKEDLHIKGDGIPIADIQVGEYQSESSTIPVKLFNISNVNENPNPPAMLGRME